MALLSSIATGERKNLSFSLFVVVTKAKTKTKTKTSNNCVTIKQ